MLPGELNENLNGTWRDLIRVLSKYLLAVLYLICFDILVRPAEILGPCQALVTSFNSIADSPTEFLVFFFLNFVAND